MSAQDDSSDIAVVGIACRVPGAPTVEAYWQLLREGRDAATHLSDESMLAAGVDAAMLRNPRYVKVGYVLPDIESFDADYFDVPNDEAELLDPQHRHFLECAVEALDDAGHDPSKTAHRIGVYAGVGMNTYLLNNLMERFRGGSLLTHYRLMLSSDKDFLASRVSYKLGLRGPSVVINTACSSSLAAIHMSCMGLLSGECDMALAGGVHIRVPHSSGYLFQEGMILSPDGHCRPFDRAAGGTNIGSGVAIVVLKRLADALHDQDRIYALVKGSAMNNDGSVKAGYTAPSATGQATVIAEAQRVAGCEPGSISYIEAHGTGTALGDPVELAALHEVFGARVAAGKVSLGAVKGNIGHLDAASGAAGLIKTCLMLNHQQLVPMARFDGAAPVIDETNSPFHVNTALRPWPAEATPRRAGVSSFGIGGTNVHVVLEEAPPVVTRARVDGHHLVVISARSERALERATGALARHLGRQAGLELGDVAFTLGQGRREHAYRRAVVARTTKDAAMALALADPQRVLTGTCSQASSSASIPVPSAATEAELRELAQRWVGGATLDWSTARQSARRVSLPSYPFERKRFWVDPTARPAMEPAESIPGLRDQLIGAPEPDREAIMVRHLSAAFADMLGPNRPLVGPSQNLFELGADSLILIEVAAKLSTELSMEVRASTLVEHPTIEAFSAYVVGKLDARPM